MSLEEFVIDFNGREEQLRRIVRWNMERRTPMFYRTNDLLHSQRVHFLVEDLVSVLREVYGNKFDVKKALYLALVHDDAEIVTGDVQVYYKDRMNSGELSRLDDVEKEAIEQLIKRWPNTIANFSYRELLYHALNKDCLEAQIISYCDKVDGYCESLHEIFAGNPKFVGASQSYVEKINNFPQKFPELAILLPSLKHPLLIAPGFLNAKEILKNAKFHTMQSVQIPTGLPHYDRWKELTIKHFDFSPLVDLKES